MGYANNGGFIRENPTNMDDLRVPVFLETTLFHRLPIKFRSERPIKKMIFGSPNRDTYAILQSHLQIWLVIISDKPPLFKCIEIFFIVLALQNIIHSPESHSQI